MLILKKIFILTFFLASLSSLNAQQKYELNQDWKYAPVEKVSADGRQISSTDFSIKNWKNATIPGTILTNLLNNGEIPDPFYGMNNEKIPDIYETGTAHYTYWFATDVKEKAKRDEQVWLTFRGINYSVDIFLNGQKVNQEPYEGMFLRKTFNITKFLSPSGRNRLAVLVHPAPVPGNPNGGQGGDGTIAKNVASQYTAGWDWIQPIKDRNTGIWDKVFIEKTGPIQLNNPHVVTLVPGKRRPGAKQQPATLKVSAEVLNASRTAVTGILVYEFDGKTIQKEVSIKGNEKTMVQLPDLVINDPKLWWPTGYGEPYLYPLKIHFDIDRRTSDSENLQVGIREIKTEWNSHTRSQQILVNGQKIFVKGGNWILSDAMLRFYKERYDTEVKFHRNMHLNLIRIWGGGLAERPEFYEACDKYGMLVIQDFWMSGDANGRWVDPKKKEDQWTRRKYPDDHQLFIKSAIDAVKMLRNHASLVAWCGGNEITPPYDILTAIKDSILPKLDPKRWFIDYSNSDEMSYNFKGGNGDGPYGIQDIATFWDERTWPFNSEVGSVGVGDAESLKRFLPKENWNVPIDQMGTEAVKDPVWTYHKYISYGHTLDAYGSVLNMEDFARKAQLVNYDQYRGLVEGFSAHKWDWYTGFIIWKTQNPWTALRGQMYDYYLDQNAGFYGLKEGGQPLHAMYNISSGDIFMVNNDFKAHYDTMLAVKAYDMKGEEKPITQVFSYIGANAVKKMFSVKKIVDTMAAKEGLFLSLQLLDTTKNVLDENFYWLPDSTGNYTGLEKLSKIDLKTEVKQLRDNKIQLTISNAKTNPVAFFNRVALEDEVTGKRVLPTFYSDNYFSIPPGVEKKIILSITEKLSKKDLQISLTGWNSDRKVIKL